MAAVIEPSSIVITKLDLVHKAGTLNLLEQLTQFDIMETIKRPCIRAFADVNDATGILANVDIVGCDVELDFYSVDDSNPSSFKFKVSEVSNVVDLGRSKSYTLDMMSPEYFKAVSTQVTEIFAELEPEKMIQIIVDQNFGTDKKFFYEETKKTDTIPITSMNALQAIDKVRRRCVSKSNKSSSYLFFENQDGFNFATIEEIYRKGKANIGDRVFTTTKFARKEFVDTDWRNVIAYEQVRASNLGETIAMGGMKNKYWAFNLETGEYTPYVFEKSADDANPEAFHLRKDLVNDYTPEDDTQQAKNRFCVIRNEDDLQRVEKSSSLAGFLPKVLSNMINVHIHGDNLMTAGRVMKLEVVKSSGLSEPQKDEMLSGNYIVGSVRHIIQRNAGILRYTNACELIRPGFVEG